MKQGLDIKAVAEEMAQTYAISFDDAYHISYLCETYAKIDLTCYLAAQHGSADTLIEKLKQGQF